MSDTPRPPFRLRDALAVPAGWPPDVLPNQIITAAHINAVKASVYAWPGDVDGKNHTLSNVNLVNATGVLADPTTAAGDLIARGPVALGAFAIGAAGQVLTVDLAAPQKLKWATPALAPVLSFNARVGAVMPAAGDYTAAMVTGALADPTTTKGDLIVHGAVTGRMPVGTDGQVLRADSAAAPFGIRWGAESVVSVFGRGGPVTAQAGDYTAAQVTNAVSVLGSYPDPSWITSFGWSKLIGVPATFAPAPHTHDAGAIVSGVLATARLGTGVADASVYLRGDGTWAAAGTGGGGGVVSVFGRAGNVIAQAGDYTAAMVTNAVSDPTQSTGDLIVRNNLNALTRLPIGANGQVLQTDTTMSVGMKWTTITAAVQTPWVTNIDAAGFNLVNVGRIGVGKSVPNYPIDVVGDINYTGVLRVNGVPVTFGGSQTPWTSNIDASGFALNNVGTLGIGTAAPQAAPLVVSSATPTAAGSIAVQDKSATAAGNPVLVVSGMSSEGSRCWAIGNRGGATYGQDFYAWNDRASAMIFGTNSAERMRITAAGLVGIGAAVPEANLHVTAATGDPTILIDVTTQSTRSPILAFREAATAVWNIGLDVTDGTKLKVATGGSFNNLPGGTKMTITVAGNVGIGTTAPAYLLDLGGSDVQLRIATWGGISGDGSGGFTAGENIYRDSTGTFRALSTHASLGGGGMSVASADIRFVNYTGAATAGATVPAVERMRITAAGLVGIGTTAPIGALDVQNFGSYGYFRGNANGASYPAAFTNGVALGWNHSGLYGEANVTFAGPRFDLSYWDSASVYRVALTVLAAGTVGIGLATPQSLLDVAGDIRGRNDLVFTKGATPMIYTSDNQDLRIGTNTTEHIRVAAATGRVGINQAVPVGTLHSYSGSYAPQNGVVASALLADGQYGGGISLITNPMGAGMWLTASPATLHIGVVENNASFGGPTGCMLIDSNNRVGILVGPLYTLDVNGDINCRGVFRVNGTPLTTGGLAGVQINSGAPTTGNFTYLNFYQLGSIVLSNGGVSGPSNNTYTVQIGTSSDRRLKRNIEPLTGGLPLIEQLRPITAEWNGLADTREGLPLTSIIAQELQEVIPGAVYPYRAKLRAEDADETELLGYDQMAIVSHLILAVQELARRLALVEETVN